MEPVQATAVAYGVMSVVTFVVFAVDKGAAAGGRRRIPERTLHLLSLCGGWPGATVAILALRHKSRKASFLVLHFLVAVVHLVGWSLYLSSP